MGSDTTSRVRQRSRINMASSIGGYLRVGSTYVALVVICGVLSLASPFFLTRANLLNILLQSSAISIIAAGLTLVIIAAELDLSIGTVQGLAGSVAAVTIIQQGVPVALGIGLGLAAGLLIGLLNGYSTVKLRMPSFIVTLATLGIAQGAGLLLTDGRPVSGFPAEYAVIGQGKVGPIPVPIIIAGVVYLLLHLLLSKTRFGIELYAVGGGREAAILAGVRANRVIVIAFATSGALAGLAGLVLSSRLGAGNGNFGSGDLLDAVAAVVVGGTSLMGGVGRVLGTLAGVLIISTVRNGLVLLDIQAFWQQIAVGTIILIAVLLDSLAKGKLQLRDLVPGMVR